MMTYDEVMEAIERGFIKGDKISIIRRNGKIQDLDVVLEELKEF